MKKSILFLAVSAILSLTISSCTKNKLIAPTTEVGPIDNPSLEADSILITYIINVQSVDTTKVTNLTNGLGYAFKDVNGNWQTVCKAFSPGGYVQVHAGTILRGSFNVPVGLDNGLFQSTAFLLSSVSGDIARNSANLATIKVYEDGVLIVDKSATGMDSVDWNYDKWNLNATKPLHR